MTCSPWQKLHFGLTVAAHDDRLTFGCDFASTFFVEVVLALVVVSNTSHRWAIKSNSCLSGGGSWLVKEVSHSRNVSQSSVEVRMGTRRWSHCIVGHFNAWRACKCFETPLEIFLRLIEFSLVIVDKSNIALTWVWIITRLLSYHSLPTRHRN